MSALRRLHRRLDALPQWLQIVAAVGALALVLALFALGALVVDAMEGESAADEAAYDNGLRLARSMTDGVSSRDEIASACFAALSAAQASNQGIEATYTSEQADAFRRGCAEGAPGVDAEVGETPESAQTSGALTLPDGSAIPADLADAYAQGQEMGAMILAQYRTLDAVSFQRLVDRWYQATVDYNVAMARQYAAAGRDPEGFPVLMPDGTMVPMRFSLYPEPEAQLNAFHQGALDAWNQVESESDPDPTDVETGVAVPEPTNSTDPIDSAVTYEQSVELAGAELNRLWFEGQQLERSGDLYENYWKQGKLSDSFWALVNQAWAAGAEFGDAAERNAEPGEIDSNRACEDGLAGYVEAHPDAGGLGGYPDDLYGNFLQGCEVSLWKAGRSPKPSGSLKPSVEVET